MKRIAAPLILILCMLFLFPVHAAWATSGSDFTEDAALAEKIDHLIQGDVALFSNTAEKYAVGSKLDVHFAYQLKNIEPSEDGAYVYMQAAYDYLFGDIVRVGNPFLTYMEGYTYTLDATPNSSLSYSGGYAYSSVIPGVKGLSTLSYETLIQQGIGCGAYIRTTDLSYGDFSEKGASMIILAYDPDTVTLLQANANGDGLIQIATYSWNDFNRSQLFGAERYIAHIIQPNLTAWTVGPIQEATTLEIRDLTYPTAFKINMIEGWTLTSGTLFTSEEASLESIRSIIMENDGTIICDTGTVPISGTRYRIKTLEYLIKFKWIFEEGRYYWILTAKDSQDRTVQMVLPFLATSYGTTKTAVRSIAYPDFDTDPDYPAVKDEWVYKIVTSYGLNMRSSAGSKGDIVTTMVESDTFTVTKKVNADGYTWGYGTSSKGYIGWSVVDNDWSVLLSESHEEADEPDASGTGSPADGEGAEAAEEGAFGRIDLMMMISYYSGRSTGTVLDSWDLDQDGEACDLDDVMHAIEIYKANTKVVGDANGDRHFDREDILLMIEFYAGISSDIVLENCDFDQDGDACDLADIMLAIDYLSR